MAAESRADMQHLELVTEVRALRISVRDLHTIFVKRTVLYWCIGVLSATLLLVTGAGVYEWHAGNVRNDRQVDKLVQSCHSRNRTASGTNRFIRGNVALQDQSAKITGEILAQLPLHLTPAQELQFTKITAEEKTLLTQWEKTQPGPVPCTLK